MEPTEAKPVKKRRRRWLVVAFVLVLASLVSWWITGEGIWGHIPVSGLNGESRVLLATTAAYTRVRASEPRSLIPDTGGVAE